MKIFLTSLVVLSSLSTASIYANESAQNSNKQILVSKAELQSMVENMHEEFMAEKAKELRKKQQARREEARKRFFFSRSGDER